MTGFTSTSDGIVIRGSHVQQFKDYLTGQKKDSPGVIVATSSTQYALTVTSEDTTNGYIFRCMDATGGTQFAVTQTGVSLGTFTGTISGKLRDKNGFVVNLEAYTTATINTGVVDTDNAWAGAIAAVTASSTTGGTIVLGPGTYLAPTSAVSMVSNLTVRGAGIDATIIKHRDQSAREPIYAFGKSNFTLTALSVFGNRTNNEHTSTGFNSAEVVIDSSGTVGTNNAVIGCKIYDFNKTAISCAGQGHFVGNNQIVGPMTATYLFVDTFTTPVQTTFGGYIGIITPANVPTTGVTIFNNQVSGLRSSGIFVGGYQTRVLYNRVWETHRWADPSPITPGGQIANTLNSLPGTSSGTAPASEMLFVGNHVGPVTTGTFAGGFDFNTANDTTCINNSVNGISSQGGVNITNCHRLRWSGGTLQGITGTALTTINDASATSTGLIFDHIAFHNNGTAVALGTQVKSFVFEGNTFSSNTTNFVNNSTTTSYAIGINHVTGGTLAPMPYSLVDATSANGFAQTILNSNISGSGLLVRAAGTNGSMYAIRVQASPSVGSTDLFAVFGNGVGQFRSSSATGSVLVLDTSITTSALRAVLTVQEGAVDKYRIGLDASDNFALMDSTGTTALMTVDTASTSAAPGVVTLLSGSTAKNIGMQMGRTAISEAMLFVASTAGVLFTGTVAGDTGLRAQNNLFVGTNTASTIMTFRPNNAHAMTIDANKNVIVGNASAALLTTATAGFLWIPYVSGTPTGNPGAPANSTGALPFVINGSANTLHFWTGAAWRTITST